MLLLSHKYEWGQTTVLTLQHAAVFTQISAGSGYGAVLTTCCCCHTNINGVRQWRCLDNTLLLSHKYQWGQTMVLPWQHAAVVTQISMGSDNGAALTTRCCCHTNINGVRQWCCLDNTLLLSHKYQWGQTMVLPWQHAAVVTQISMGSDNGAALTTRCCCHTNINGVRQWCCLDNTLLLSHKYQWGQTMVLPWQHAAVVTHNHLKLMVYRQTSNTRHSLLGNKLVDHSNVVGASSFST